MEAVMGGALSWRQRSPGTQQVPQEHGQRVAGKVRMAGRHQLLPLAPAVGQGLTDWHINPTTGGRLCPFLALPAPSLTLQRRIFSLQTRGLRLRASVPLAQVPSEEAAERTSNSGQPANTPRQGQVWPGGVWLLGLR